MLTGRISPRAMEVKDTSRGLVRVFLVTSEKFGIENSMDAESE